MKILFILLFPFNFSTLKSIVENFSSVQFSTPLNSLTTINCQNNFNMYSGSLFVSNNLLLKGNTLTIGNTQQPTIITIPNLPEAHATDKYLLCMLSLGSNLVYLGDKNSPAPPPDFISIPLLQTNEILMYDPVSKNALNTTYFNNLQGGDIFIGNSNIQINIMSPSIINFNTKNTDILKTNNNSLYSIIFSCPNLNISGIKTTNTLTAKKVSLYNTNTISGENGLFKKEGTEINSSSTTFGNNDLSTVIEMEGAIFDSQNITLGAEAKPLLKITNIPLVDYVSGPPYLVLSEKDNTTLYHTASANTKEIIKKKCFEKNKFTVDAINKEGKSDIIFTAPSIIFDGKIYSNNTIKLYNKKFIGKCIFNNTQFSDQSIIEINNNALIGEKTGKLNIDNIDTELIFFTSMIQFLIPEESKEKAISCPIHQITSDQEGIIKKINFYNEINEVVFNELQTKIDNIRAHIKTIKEKVKTIDKKIKKINQSKIINKKIIHQILYFLSKENPDYE